MKNRFRGLSESRRLEMLQMSVEEIYNDVYQEGFEKGYHVGKHNERTGACEAPAPKSPNQLRAELIQRAREFVEKHERDLPGHGESRRYGNKTCRDYYYNTDFLIKNGKVTAVVDRLSHDKKPLRKAINVGRAKCHPDEVFNADIGKAIALARALEIEIPQEFMKAVQPDGIVSGMVIEHAGALFTTTEHTGRCRFASTAKIIDDSNAEYEVPSC